MPDYFSAATDLIGGITGFLGSKALAKGATAAGNYYREAATITQQSTALKEMQVQRTLYQSQSSAQAAISANNLTESGSAADILRSNAQQGAITKSVVEQQGRITEQAYLGQAGEADAEASAAKTKGSGSLLGGIIGAGLSLFSDDRLKEVLSLVERRANGLGIYTFKLNGHPEIWQGVLASEVEAIIPEAITVQDGFRKVDYKRIGVELKKVA